MDPITSIGLLASVSNLALATKDVIQLMRSFRDGEEEIGELINNVSVF